MGGVAVAVPTRARVCESARAASASRSRAAAASSSQGRAGVARHFKHALAQETRIQNASNDDDVADNSLALTSSSSDSSLSSSPSPGATCARRKAPCDAAVSVKD